MCNHICDLIQGDAQDLEKRQCRECYGWIEVLLLNPGIYQECQECDENGRARPDCRSKRPNHLSAHEPLQLQITFLVDHRHKTLLPGEKLDDAYIAENFIGDM